MNTSYSNSVVNTQNIFWKSKWWVWRTFWVSGGEGGPNDPEELSTKQKQDEPSKITAFSPYFGVEYVPYTKSASYPIGDYTKEDLKEMLTVILTKCHSVLTLEMGFEDQSYDGPWDITTASIIGQVAAGINSDHHSRDLSNIFGNRNGGSGGSSGGGGGGGGPSDPEELSTKQKQEKPSKIAAFSPYFGVEFFPYSKSASYPVGDYTKEDLKEMLTVILKKCHSVLTLEMGFKDQSYDGPWDITTASVIAQVAAQINSDHNSRVLTISQGAGVLNKEGNQPDIEAAFSAVEPANSLYPNTIWSITLIPNYNDLETDGGVRISKSGNIVLTQLQKYWTKAHQMNLKFGVILDSCQDIFGTGHMKDLLVDLSKSSDYFICSIYPRTPVSEDVDYFNVAVNLFGTIKQAFGRIAPGIEILLKSGWATGGISRNNPEYLNSPKKSKAFWNLMGKWAEDKKVRVFMQEAFDVPRNSGNNSWGYWRREDNGQGEDFVEKANGEQVLF